MILICPTAFKETIPARRAAAAMAAGARRAAPGAEVRPLPLSDGGNGLLDMLEAAAGGKARAVRVPSPLGTSVSARYLVQDGRVVVETAEACGLHLVPRPLRNPMVASTRGVGELLLAARSAASDSDVLVVGLGGSATVDAGVGMGAALGWRFLDASGEPVPAGGAGLLELAAVEPPADAPWPGELVVLADVTNPLLGERGAARVFGPQKGATAAQVESLERGLALWARVVERDLGVDVAGLEGSGAAGGLGAAFAALLGSPPSRGADWLLGAVGFDGLLRDAEAVVTGEGAWDGQSGMGKVTGEVVARCRAAGVPVLLVTGSVTGAPPEGVVVATGDGEPLDAADLTRLVADTVSGLLARRRSR